MELRVIQDRTNMLLVIHSQKGGNCGLTDGETVRVPSRKYALPVNSR